MSPKIAIVFYSLFGHTRKLAEAEQAGIEEAGGHADLYQVRESLPQEVLLKMRAPEKDESIPIITPEKLGEYDAFLFGIPTRFGNFPAQWKIFWDSTSQLWHSGGLHGKYCGIFTSTGTLGGGQESTFLAAMSTLVHHGVIFVPLGYAKALQTMMDVSEVRGGGPWGAGTFAPFGQREPSQKELDLAKVQGKTFYETVVKVEF